MPKVVRMVKRGRTPDAQEEPEAHPVAAKKSKKADDAAPSEKRSAPSRYKGVTTGMRVMEFQDHTLKENFKNKLTDEQLAELWRTEFPRAKKFTAGIVRIVRRLFNEGTHGKQAWTPPKPLHEFDETGNKVPLPEPRQARAKKSAASASVEEEVEATPVKRGKKR